MASSGLLAIGKLGETQAELVEIIDHEVAMLADLTTRLLKTAALDAKEIVVRHTSVSLLPFMEGILVGQDADTRRRIQILSPGQLRDVQADANLLNLALAQLIDNASKYSRVGTGIALSLRQDETRTVIR